MRVSFLLLMMMSSPLGAIADTRIALLGDNYRVDLLKKWVSDQQWRAKTFQGLMTATTSDGSFTFVTPVVGASIEKVTNIAYKSDATLVVVDSTIGPLPIVRDHIIVARQADVPLVTVAFANIRKLHDYKSSDFLKLIELEESDMRELFAAYELGRNGTIIFYSERLEYHDLRPARSGILEIMRVLNTLKPKRTRPAHPDAVSEFNGYYYLLTVPETNHYVVSLSPKNRVRIWCSGNSSAVRFSNRLAVKPGANLTLFAHVEKSLRCTIGSRTLITENGHLVGIGVLTNVIR